MRPTIAVAIQTIEVQRSIRCEDSAATAVKSRCEYVKQHKCNRRGVPNRLRPSMNRVGPFWVLGPGVQCIITLTCKSGVIFHYKEHRHLNAGQHNCRQEVPEQTYNAQRCIKL